MQNTFFSLIVAFFIFTFASITDFLDGFVARKKNLVSDLGKILDPIADKILIMGVFLAFIQEGVIEAWMVGVIILREFLITSLRLYALNKGVVLEAKRFGKHKTLSQVIAIFLIFIILILSKRFAGKTISFLYSDVISWVMWYVVGITLFSGFYYLWQNRREIKTF